MATEVLMPKLGLTMTEGTILEWKKKEGDPVRKGDLLFSVETDKLTNDVEADADGTLLKILVPEGETSGCKTVIAYIGAPGETVGAAPASAAVPAPAPVPAAPAALAPSAAPKAPREGGYGTATPYAKKLAHDKGFPLGEISATGPRGMVMARDVEAFSPAPRVKLSPMAARLAEEMGVDVSVFESVNRIMKADVLGMVHHEEPAAPAPAAVSAAAPPECAGEKPEKVSALRRSIAANMSASWSISPRVTYTHPVDATAMKQLRASLKDEFKEQGIKLTYNHILMMCTARALTEFPDVNASFRDNMITRHHHVNLGLAVAKGDGLIVPNLKNCEALGLAEIAKGTEAMIEAARTGKLTMDGMTGGTFTISSLGPYGITSFSPIINQPELAILGVCDIVDTPVVREGQVVVRPMMNLCLTADHRVIDGVMASRFLRRITELLENPCRLLA